MVTDSSGVLHLFSFILKHDIKRELLDKELMTKVVFDTNPNEQFIGILPKAIGQSLVITNSLGAYDGGSSEFIFYN